MRTLVPIFLCNRLTKFIPLVSFASYLIVQNVCFVLSVVLFPVRTFLTVAGKDDVIRSLGKDDVIRSLSLHYFSVFTT